MTTRPLTPPLPLAGERSMSFFFLLSPHGGERLGEGGGNGA